jgi:hypothetical protein
MSQIIDWNEQYRIRVETEDQPQCPRGDWDFVTGALTVEEDRRYMAVPPVHEFPGPLQDAHDRIRQSVNDDPCDAVVRWAKVFYDITLDWTNEHGITYWWVDPDQLVDNWYSMATRTYSYDGAEIDKAELEMKVIRQDQETYRAWADNEVYGVIVEEFTLWGKLSMSGASLLQGDDTVKETWEEVASCWGYYLDAERDDDEQFIEFAQEQHDIGERA